MVVGTEFLGKAVTYGTAKTVDSNEKGEDGSQYPVETLKALTAGSVLLDRKLTLTIVFFCDNTT